MPIDPMQAARLHRNLRTQSQRKHAHQAHIAHAVMPQDQFDPSLSNRLAYGNRADWYAAAAMNGFCDVDLAANVGLRRYLVPSELVQIAHAKRNKGMNLYE